MIRALLATIVALIPLGCSAVPPMPVAMSNNAVAIINADDGPRIYSMTGLEAGKTWRDVSARSFAFANDEWRELSDPAGPGRLAAVAVAARGNVYLMGGYTVAEDGSEVSTPEVYQITDSNQWLELPGMPVPVDDAVAAVYRDRYIILVSGWHNDGNVSDVQILDLDRNAWLVATPFPGQPLFGHAGGLVGNTLVICGGAHVAPLPEGKRTFRITEACFAGEIDADDPRQIEWRSMEHHPGAPLYRAAATGTSQFGGVVVFAGGTDNPYNYDAHGYDGNPAHGRAGVFGYRVATAEWLDFVDLPAPTMDHRGLLEDDSGWFYIVGGMDGTGKVTSAVTRFRLERR